MSLIFEAITKKEIEAEDSEFAKFIHLIHASEYFEITI